MEQRWNRRQHRSGYADEMEARSASPEDDTTLVAPSSRQCEDEVTGGSDASSPATDPTTTANSGSEVPSLLLRGWWRENSDGSFEPFEHWENLETRPRSDVSSAAGEAPYGPQSTATSILQDGHGQSMNFSARNSSSQDWPAEVPSPPSSTGANYMGSERSRSEVDPDDWMNDNAGEEFRTFLASNGDVDFRVSEAPARQRFACDQCPESFAWAKHLRHHVALHHDPASYQCIFSECIQTFVGGASYNTHLRAVHGIDAGLRGQTQH
ncbi:uncharacterized protein LTR77_007939 [Saxophila tyrrhenica]|uniref:C2H2-type domain-containing protein n=1 Tax=Saxophila tyrrhenica TaxID=1690608 RepID=A0AAV9P471_9PEZI|nr:hypothetical protein LTR77_007939 [Saxophila tyrrhenica]